MNAPQSQPVAPAAPATGKIGERFVRAGLLTPAQVDQAVALQQAESIRFGEAAIRLGFLTEQDVQAVLSDQFNYATARADPRSIDASLAIAHRSFGVEAEAIRRIRAELSIRLSALPKIAIAVVSPNPGEGKSYLAASLAIAFSQSGRRTLLVNANLRGSGQQELLRPTETSPGLSSMLAGRAPLAPGVQVPGFPLLNALPAGPQPPKPTEMLHGGALQRLWESCQDRFDVCIIDTPAALLSSDAQIIAAQADACVLVGRQHVTALADLEEVQALMLRAGAQVAGSVYNTFGTPQRPARTPLGRWWQRRRAAGGASRA